MYRGKCGYRSKKKRVLRGRRALPAEPACIKWFLRISQKIVQNLFLNADIFPGVLGAECFQQGRYPGDDLRPGFLYRIYPVFRQPDKNLPVVA